MKYKLTQDVLKELIHYDPETGLFTWRERGINYCKDDRSMRIFNSNFCGKKAGNYHKNRCGKEYMEIRLLTFRFYSHDLAYLYMTGEFPIEVDHIDGNGLNNKWSNLRNVSNQENKKNRRLESRNKSGFNGVYWHKINKTWIANIGINGKTKYLGSFLNKDEAIRCRALANIEYDFHDNHGKERPL